MSSSDIRLRLVIRRHALPEVKLVWPCTASDDLTIARLLSNVNEVVPLESTHWGLEDYAVELTDPQGSSFECLHFQQINKILKHDDQVLIRALLTDDLKRRRISGRDQISADGKHLFDGVAFGRPWLRAPRGRPQLDIIPRKRARITYEAAEEDDSADDEQATSNQLQFHEPQTVEHLEGLSHNSVGLRATFDDGDQQQWGYADGDGFEDEDDFENDDAFETEANGQAESQEQVAVAQGEATGNNDLSQGLQLLKRDHTITETEDGDNTAALLEPDDEAPALSSIAIAGVDELLPLRDAFPLTPFTSIRDEYKRQNGDLKRAYQALSMYNDPRISFDEMMEEALCGSTGFRSTLQQDLKNAREAKQARPLIQVVDSDPADSNNINGTAAAGKPHLQPKGIEDITMQSSQSDDDDTSSSDSSSGEEDSSDSSDDEPSSGDGKSSTGAADGPRKRKAESSPEPSTSSSDDESDDADGSSTSESETSPQVKVRATAPSESRSATAGLARLSAAVSDSTSSSDSNSSSESDSGPDIETALKPKSPAPTKTGRGDASSKAKELRAEPQLEAPPGRGLTRTQKRNKRRRLAQSMKKTEQVAREPAAKQESTSAAAPVAHQTEEVVDDGFEARKAALLASLGQSSPEATKIAPSHPDDDGATAQSKDDVKNDDKKPRMRMDLGAGRRMLFGALGMKNPKTKEDEQKLRDSLLKDVKPLKNHRLAASEPAAKSDSSSSSDDTSDDDDEDDWKDKISYRAVECCQEGITLSEPPFPFVQRWDPQQQYTSRKKRKRQSQAVFDEEHVGDESTYSNVYEDAHETFTESSRKKHRPVDQQEPQPDGDQDADADSQQIGELQESSDMKAPKVDDLPELPENLESLPILKPGDAKHGMVITWKDWTLGKGDQWTPQLVSLTGLVVNVHSDRSLSVLLAQRDRKQDDRQFDPDTGERIYSKFEMPGFDDEDEEEDDGHREVSLDNMLDPRMLQREPSPEAWRHMAAGINDTANQHEDSSLMDVDQGIRAASKDQSSSSSIPSGQPHLHVGSNSFNQLFAATASEPGSAAAVVKEVQNLSPQAANSSREQVSALITVVDDDAQEGEAAARLAEKEISDQAVALAEASPTGEAASHSPKTQGPISVARTDSQRSLASGRQVVSPQPHLASADQEDSLIPETLPQAHATPVTDNNGLVDSANSSPLPDVDEIFYTARVTKVSKSPKKSPPTSQRSHQFKSDPGYQEVMQKLDDGEESDERDTKKATRNLFVNASQPAQAKSATGARRKSAKQNQTPFTVPVGSQIIDLEDSAPESANGAPSPAASSRSAGSDSEKPSNGSQKQKKRKRTEASLAVKTRGLEFNSSPSANTRQRKGSVSSYTKRGRGRPRKSAL